MLLRENKRTPGLAIFATASLLLVLRAATFFVDTRDLTQSMMSMESSTEFQQPQLSASTTAATVHKEADEVLLKTPETEVERPIKENHKILIATFLFGENTANKRSLRLFVESAKRSGVDYLIVGHPAPPFPLPTNVKYIKVTWDDLTDRVKERVFDGQEPGEMRSIETYYKINDLKPLFAHIFPEQVQDYDWWGYIDSDLIVGDLRHWLTPDLLSQYDILSPTTRSYTVGPFMLFRNTRVVNELFFLARRPLMEIFGVERCRSFDEWGGIFYGLPRGHNPGYNDYRSSMAGIIEYHGKRLGLRWRGNAVQFVWDGFCRGYVGSSCKECELVQLTDGTQKLVQRPLGGSYKMEVFFCHYQYSKQTMEKSLADDARFHELIQEGQYRINFFDGFNFLNTTGPTHLDGQVMLQMPPFEILG